MGSTTVELSPMERVLLEQELVTEKQLRRARRVAALMREPKPIDQLLVDTGQLTHADRDRVTKIIRSRLSIVEILHESGRLDDAQIAEYERSHSARPDASAHELLVDSGLVDEEAFARAVSEKHDIPFVEPEIGLIDRKILRQASSRYLLRHKVLPMRAVDGVLTVLMTDPLDTQLVAELEGIFKCRVRPSCSTSERIVEAIRTLEQLDAGGVKGQAATTLQYREIGDSSEQEATGEGAVQIVDHLITRAIQLGASDLHVEPMQNKTRVRVRVDGVLRKLTELPVEFSPQVISRIKVLGQTDIAERRLHQDGRIFVKFEGREVDIRVSTYVSAFGETIVLRLLDRRGGLIPLDDIGFVPPALGALRDVVLRTSSGLVLITGPTGSGKTTTLYSFIDYVNDEEMKVITAEDPVEYVLEGTTQCSVNAKTGPTFPDSLRAMLRQDPDIIAVGEIRDGVTANLAVESALTGHKVFSSLHTQDSVGAVVRLTDMGVEPFLVASTLGCIVAQRLIRRICPECREDVRPEPEQLRFLGLTRSDVDGIPFFAGRGCAACESTGFKGRRGIHEVLVPDDDFRDAILSRASSKELRSLARSLPAFFTLQEDGLIKAMDGVTTIPEILTAVHRDVAARKPRQLMKLVPTGRRR